MTRAHSSSFAGAIVLAALSTCAPAAHAQEAMGPDAPPCFVGPCDPPPAPAPAAAPATTMTPRPKVPTFPAMRIYGGIGYRRLYDVSFVGGEVTAGVGVRKEKLTVLGRLSFASSKSSGGLVLRDLGLGVEMDYRAIGIFHVGGGGGFSLGMLRRATNDHTLYDVSIGVYGFAALDILPIGEHALFVQATLAGELFMGHSSVPFLWGPSAAAGIRY